MTAMDRTAPDDVAQQRTASVDEGSLSYPGWRVVAACFAMAVFAWGFGFYGHGFYLAEMQRAHGWPATAVAGATTVFYLLGAFLGAFTGDLIARWGARTVTVGGIMITAVAAALIPLAGAPWQLTGAYALMAFGWAATSLTAITTILGTWFSARRGLAISIGLTGASFGGIVVVPLLAFASERWGFAASVWAVAVGLGGFVAVLALTFFARDPPFARPRSSDSVSADTPTKRGALLYKRRVLVRFRTVRAGVFRAGWLSCSPDRYAGTQHWAGDGRHCGRRDDRRRRGGSPRPRRNHRSRRSASRDGVLHPEPGGCHASRLGGPRSAAAGSGLRPVRLLGRQRHHLASTDHRARISGARLRDCGRTVERGLPDDICVRAGASRRVPGRLGRLRGPIIGVCRPSIRWRHFSSSGQSRTAAVAWTHRPDCGIGGATGVPRLGALAVVDAATDYSLPSAERRRIMVDRQVRTYDVTDQVVISRMLDVEREHFVSTGENALAYSDLALDLAGDAGPRSRTMLPPFVLARMMQAVAPKTTDRALDVCGGTGYTAALLAGLCASVVTVEPDGTLFAQAKSRLADLGLRNVDASRASRCQSYPTILDLLT